MDKLTPYLPVIYRFVRTTVAAALTQAILTEVDWSKPEDAFRLILASFAAGLLTSISKAIRDLQGGSKYNQINAIDKFMPI